MDTRLVIAVMFVVAVTVNRAAAQNTTEAANATVSNTGNTTAVNVTGNTTTGNATTTAGAGNGNTTTGNATTTAGAGNGNTTTGNATTIAGAGNGNTTTGNATTIAGAGNGNTTTGNATTTAGAGNGNTTTGNATTIAGAGNGNTTTGNATTTAGGGNGNTTTGNATTTAGAGNGNTTTGNATTVATTAPPLTPNTTVEDLNATISRTNCGTKVLCAAQPSSCDPSTDGSCFFLGAQQQSGQNFLFDLSGISPGYIAATLSPGTSLGANAATYVCANNNGRVKFFSTALNNGVLTPTVLNVNSVKGKISGNKIQCRFAATVPSPVTKAGDTTLQVSSGSYNSTSDSLGPVNPQLRSTVADLANPNTTVINSLSTNTTNSTTTSPGTTNQQSLMQALLITVGVLGLAMP